VLRPRTFGSKRVWIAAGLVVLVVAGVALLLSGVAPKSLTTSSSPPAIFQPLKRPFTINGARYEVQPANDASWAAEMREQEPREGRRWVAVGVPVRNVSRADLRPRGLGYRIITPAGLVVGPEMIGGRQGTLDEKGRLAKGELTSVHLGFQVPEQARKLTFALDAGGIRQPSARVLLGPEG